MAVVIDEMESTVETDSHSTQTAESAEHQAPSPKAVADELAGNLRRLARWQNRLKAD
jgi:hypothetical protein